MQVFNNDKPVRAGVTQRNSPTPPMQVESAPKKKSKLTLYIVIALVIGIALGFILNKNYLYEENKSLEALDAKIA
ncbi:MAG: hypothetical protein C0523_05680, partial [Cytophaga sp.]|nr:hypothetical protein [Cytophaga sp.]